MPDEQLTTDAYPTAIPDYTYYGIIPFDAEGALRVYDGDTVELCLDLGMEHWTAPVYYRLYGIQAAEVHPLTTREEGIAARDHLRGLIAAHAVWENTDTFFPGRGLGIIVKTHKKLRAKTDYRPREVRGKFGRWLVELLGNNMNLNQLMLDDGFATPYLP